MINASAISDLQLQPSDQILAVNGEDVKEAPRDHVIQLVRSCEHQVSLLVCQPEQLPCSPGRKSTLLSPARKEKLRNKRPSRVRFAESVCVNGAPLFPVSKYNPHTQSYSQTIKSSVMHFEHSGACFVGKVSSVQFFLLCSTNAVGWKSPQNNLL